jgi:hypothetical protein
MSGNRFGRGTTAGIGAEDRFTCPSLTSHLSTSMREMQGYEMPRYVNRRERRFPTWRVLVAWLRLDRFSGRPTTDGRPHAPRVCD